MKPFWDNLFCDMEERGMTKDVFAIMAGNGIRDDLRQVEDAIRNYDGKKALEIIDDLKKSY